MKHVFSFVLIVFLITATTFAGGNKESTKADDTIVVGVSFAEYSRDRWPREAALLTDLGRRSGVQVITQVANQDPKLQNDQIENMVLQGADVLIIIAQDGDAAAAAVDAAAAEGIPTIAYDRLIKSPNLSAYLTFDNVEVGRAQGRGVTALVDEGRFVMLGGSPTDNNAVLFRQGQMEVVQELVDAGKVEIVADQWVENGNNDNALKIMENILTATNNRIDAVVASTDGIALGALQAMKAQGLAGLVPISGQDATLAGCKSIVEGELNMTVFKDVRKLSPIAMDMAIALAKGEEIPGLQEYSLAELTLDDSLQGSVPCRFLPVVQVNADNLYEEVILTGYQPYDDVYRDVLEADRPPRPQN